MTETTDPAGPEFPAYDLDDPAGPPPPPRMPGPAWAALPDVERAALALLAGGRRRRPRATHPFLAAWLRRLATEAGYRDDLDGFGCPIVPRGGTRMLSERVAEHDAQAEEYADATGDEGPDGPLGAYQRARDAALLLLGNAVVRFRRAGREARAGDALADGLMDYVDDTEDAWAQRLLDEETLRP